jgi:hypothetical protein
MLFEGQKKFVSDVENLVEHVLQNEKDFRQMIEAIQDMEDKNLALDIVRFIKESPETKAAFLQHVKQQAFNKERIINFIDEQIRLRKEGELLKVERANSIQVNDTETGSKTDTETDT